MLVAISACHKDLDRAIELAEFLPDMPCDYGKHSALVVGSFTLAPSHIYQLAARFTAAGFKNVVAIRAQAEETPSWPNGANAMWRLAVDWVKNNARTPFLWLEPDSIPVKPGWLDAIEAEYMAAHRPFMGTIYSIPFNHLNGIAVYPANINKYNPLYFNSEFFNLPFDCVRPDLTSPWAHITKLIWRGLADPSTNTPHSFPTQESLSIIPSDCVLAHCCKDGSLIARLRGQNDPVPAVAPQPSIGERIVSGVVSGVKTILGSSTNYYHSGNLGDICYALPAIKAAGGGSLTIGPEQRKTNVCSVPIDRKQYEMFEPLLKAQPYLDKVSFSEKYPVGCRDLNHFRNTWVNRTAKQKHGIDTLCEAHFFELGILDKFDEQTPWLECGPAIDTGKIIIHRSPRYHSPPAGPESFPWRELVKENQGEMLFVGLQSEHDAFVREFNAKIPFWKCTDFLELARVIKGGLCFVGNQSFPLSVAIGLGQHVAVEALTRSPDCRFKRVTYQDQLIGKIKL